MTSWQQFLSDFHAENERFKTAAKIAMVKRINDAANRETAWHDQQWQIKQERMKQDRIESKKRRQVEYLSPMGIDEGLKGHSIYDYGRDVDWRTEEPAKLQRDLP